MTLIRRRTWKDLTGTERLGIMFDKTSEMLQGLTPYQRACMLKVHMAEAGRRAIDPVAKRVMDDAVERFNSIWKHEVELYGVDGRNAAGL